MEGRWLLFPSGLIISLERDTWIVIKTSRMIHTVQWKQLLWKTWRTLTFPYGCHISYFLFSLAVRSTLCFVLLPNCSNCATCFFLNPLCESERAVKLNHLSAAVHCYSCAKSTQKRSDLSRVYFTIKWNATVEGNLFEVSALHWAIKYLPWQDYL